MVDRQDLDALLISALYGELTPADEARLQTHLDSHPSDRTALADLTLARKAVRDSRIFQVQLDPPQAVSALLLQEAARRAPARAVQANADRADRESWFQRFVRSFVSHPAMAAAAMLVLVVGVAGTLYMRGDAKFAEQTAERASDTAATPSRELQPGALATGSSTESESKLLQQHAGSSYQATLEEGRYAKDQWKGGSADGAEKPGAKNEADTAGAAAPTKPAIVAPKPPSRSGGDMYLSTDREELKPKDLDDRRQAKKSAAKPDSNANGDFAASDESVKIAGKPNGGGATRGGNEPTAGLSRNNTQTVSPSPPPPAVTTGNTRDARVAADKTDGKADTTKVPAAPAPVSPEERNDAQKEAQDAGLLSWAKDTHARVIAQVKVGNCRDAGALALSLANRAPGYYVQNVQNDRAVKTCITYINAEREKAADKANRARATTKRAEEPAKAAPTTTTK